MVSFTHAYAEANKTYYFDQLSLNEGLSQSTVKTIFRDKIGLLWIGTRDGLNKYDGNEIKKYYSLPGNTTSLPSNEVKFITEDANNTLWILTSGSLCRYERKSDSFIRENINGRECSFEFALPYKNKVYFPAPNALFIYHCDENRWEECYFTDQSINLTLSCKIVPIDDENIYLASQ